MFWYIWCQEQLKNTWADFIKRKKEHSFLILTALKIFPGSFFTVYYRLKWENPKRKKRHYYCSEWMRCCQVGRKSTEIKYWLKSIFCDKMCSLTVSAFYSTATMSGIVKSEKSDECWAFFRRIQEPLKLYRVFIRCLSIANTILCISTFLLSDCQPPMGSFVWDFRFYALFIL